MDELRENLKNSQIVKRGLYKYIITPLSDGIPQIEPSLLRRVSSDMIRAFVNFGKPDKFVTMEAMGIPITTCISLKTGIPFNVVRKRQYFLPNEVEVVQTTKYHENQMYINGLEEGDDIVIIDSIISTGNTLRAVIRALLALKVNILGVVVIFSKGNQVISQLEEQFKIPICSLVVVKVNDDDKIRVSNSYKYCKSH